MIISKTTSFKDLENDPMWMCAQTSKFNTRKDGIVQLIEKKVDQ